MIKAIIFDFFGVIVDENFDKVYKSFGGDVQKDSELIRDTYYLSHIGKIGRSSGVFAKHLGVSKELWEQRIDEGRSVDQFLLNYISELRKEYKVAILSNIGSRGLDAYVSRRLLKDNFDAVVESSKIGFAKPEARAYEIAADSVGVRCDECVFIDDRQEYVDGAVEVDMKVILYKNLEQLKVDLEKVLHD